MYCSKKRKQTFAKKVPQGVCKYAISNIVELTVRFKKWSTLNQNHFLLKFSYLRMSLPYPIKQ